MAHLDHFPLAQAHEVRDVIHRQPVLNSERHPSPNERGKLQGRLLYVVEVSDDDPRLRIPC